MKKSTKVLRPPGPTAPHTARATHIQQQNGTEEGSNQKKQRIIIGKRWRDLYLSVGASTVPSPPENQKGSTAKRRTLGLRDGAVKKRENKLAGSAAWVHGGLRVAG